MAIYVACHLETKMTVVVRRLTGRKQSCIVQHTRTTGRVVTRSLALPDQEKESLNVDLSTLETYYSTRYRTMETGDPARHGGVLLLLTFEPCGRIFPHRLQTAALGPTSLTSEKPKTV